MLTDLSPDPELAQQVAAEKAFVASAEYCFLGRKLEPYSFTRETAAEMLGLRYGNVPEADLIRFPNPRKAWLAAGCLPDGTPLTDEQRKTLAADPEEVVMYRGMARDIAIVLWLMHQTADVARQARDNPKRYVAEIDDWAEAQQLAPGAANSEEAMGLFSQVMADLAASRGRPDLSKSKAASACAAETKNG